MRIEFDALTLAFEKYITARRAGYPNEMRRSPRYGELSQKRLNLAVAKDALLDALAAFTSKLNETSAAEGRTLAEVLNDALGPSDVAAALEVHGRAFPRAARTFIPSNPSGFKWRGAGPPAIMPQEENPTQQPGKKIKVWTTRKDRARG